MSYRQGACSCVFHPPVVFCAPDTNQLVQVTGLCLGVGGSVSRNRWIFLQACASAKQHGEDSDPSQQSQAQENSVAVCTEELQHTLTKLHCTSRLIQKGFGQSLLLHTIPENVWSCNVHKGWSKDWGIFWSGTRAGESSSRGTPPPCHSAPAALNPLLGDKRE